MLEIFLISVVCAPLALCLWGLACNEWTFRERMRRLSAMRGLAPSRYWLEAAAYEQVSYDQHMWARFFFLDPNKLYAKAGASHV